MLVECEKFTRPVAALCTVRYWCLVPSAIILLGVLFVIQGEQPRRTVQRSSPVWGVGWDAVLAPRYLSLMGPTPHTQPGPGLQLPAGRSGRGLQLQAAATCTAGQGRAGLQLQREVIEDRGPLWWANCAPLLITLS